MKAHQQWGATLIIASHDMQWLHQVCDEVFYLFRGHLVGTDRPTYIFGPWSPAENGNIGKSLGQDQQFIAPMSPPASATAVASLEARKISIYTTPEEVPAESHHLQGILAQLGYDKNNRGLHAQVLVGTTTFYVDVPAESTRTRTYLPGQPVTIAYDPKAVQWHG